MLREKVFALASALSVLLVGVLGPAEPVHAADSVSINTLNVVRPGSTNAKDFQVDVVGYDKNRTRIGFANVTLLSSGGNQSVTARTDQFSQCGTTGIYVRSLKGESTVTCLTDASGFIVWASLDVSIKFGPGSLRFAESPTSPSTWQVFVQRHNGTSYVTLESPNLLRDLEAQTDLQLIHSSGTFGSPLSLSQWGNDGG